MSSESHSETLRAFSQHVNAPYVELLKRLGLDLEFVHATGAIVRDRDGRPFIDCIAGYGNLNVGHNAPEVIEAVVDELRSPRPFSWPFVGGAHARLAQRLARLAPGELECSLIVNSGAEAVDSALKLARLAKRKPLIVAAQGAWHGYTLGALSVSEPSMCRSFEPLLGGVTHVPYGNAGAVEQAIQDRTGAVIVEPIQAESGAVMPPPGYLRALVEICRRKDVVLIFDEIKTGIGKTGRVFACEHEDAVPDVLLVGKSLGGGAMPIGALIAHRRLWGAFGYSFGMSSSSGAGNAPACAAAVATLDLLEKEQLCGKAATHGERLFDCLQSLAKRYPRVVTGASGRGLLAALHTDSMKSATEIVIQCIQRGVLVMNAFCNKTRILIEPPLCITVSQLDTALFAIEAAVAHVAARLDPG